MKKLIVPGTLVLSLLLLGALNSAQACDDMPNLFPNGPHAGATHGDYSKKQPDITFKTDGNDVLASIQVTANGSPHALSTSYHVSADNVVTLHYTLVQNADRLVRCTKNVTIEWRLKDFAVLPTPLLNYHVESTYLALSASEVKTLTTQLQFLFDEPEDLVRPIQDSAEATIIKVTLVDRKDRPGELLVNVGKPNGLVGRDKARVILSETLKIEKMQDGRRQPADYSDLKEGVVIQFSGFQHVAQSYPVQVTPTHILILEIPKLELRSRGE